MKKLTIVLLSVVMLDALFSSCDNKQKKPPVDLKEQVVQNGEVSVPYSELGGVKTIPVKLNGVSMDMIFDTGCSGMSISLNELLTMQKNGKFSENDIVGITEATIADGSVVENGLINLHEVEIGGKDGIILHNVKASVALNQIAPILLGNGVIDAVASVEVDNINKIIKFKRR
ncbi:MAG: retroviral-like aspartic protease family protein [Bacteroidaceae bacterium]|nr:retroviral-like aspartic protease family protein [Bacteroidaceae bacterium]